MRNHWISIEIDTGEKKNQLLFFFFMQLKQQNAEVT